MPKALRKQELERRLARGKSVRIMMVQKDITNAMLRKALKIKSRQSVFLALRKGALPALLDRIEKYVRDYRA
jgi:hypothetical protein